MSEAELTVALGDRSYPVVMGALSGLGARAAACLRPGRCVLVTNDVVAPLYAAQVIASLEGAGWSVEQVVLPDGERNKTVETWQGVVSALLDHRVERRTPVFALGGGVTGDIAGFAAATCLRGLPVVQIPTTLLSMVDSSVGGKTGVNTSHGKNLVGAFHQPSLVYAAVETLDTLTDDELRCGLGEVVKHAVIADPEFFDWLDENAPRILARDHSALQHVVIRCCAIKAEVVAADEREVGRRAVLNLGHTIGHALEATLGYGTLRHGEAVGIGMVAEAWLAARRGSASEALPRRIAGLLNRLGLPIDYPGISTDSLLEAVGMDKKRAHGRITVTIPHRIGDVRLESLLPYDLLVAAQAVSGAQEI